MRLHRNTLFIIFSQLLQQNSNTYMLISISNALLFEWAVRNAVSVLFAAAWPSERLQDVML